MSMIFLKSTTTRWIVVTMLLLLTVQPLLAQHTLEFGNGGEVRYNEATGTATVVVSGAEIITSAYAVVKDGTVTLSSKDYTNRTVTLENINDAFGAGEKMTVAL